MSLAPHDRRSWGRRFPHVDRRVVGALLAVLWFAGVMLVGPQGSMGEPASRMLAIFGAAVVLWITEAIPLAATSILVILTQILLISDEAIVGLPADFEAPSYESIFAALADPVLMLFLGGFVLADAATKYGLDRNLAGLLLRPFGTAPRSILAGLMFITALLSMFMSNTATTAAMMAVVLPVVAGLDADDRLRAAVVLSVPLAANIGGIGTPVGTPPNAIVIGRMSQGGDNVSFLEWMVMAVPVVLVMLVIAWFALTRLYRTETTHLEVRLGGAFDRSRPAVVLYVVFTLTVLGWMTEPLHGVPSAIVGFLPVVVLMATRVIGSDDVRRVNWHVLWLVGGGIALGNGVASTQLDGWFVDRFDWGSMSPLAFAAALAAISIGLSTVISNSATANLVAPIGIGIAVSGAVDMSPVLAGLIIAMSCSLAMALPISTPPNAIAYSSGMVEPREMARVGVIVGVVGVALVAGAAPPIWRALGLV